MWWKMVSKKLAVAGADTYTQTLARHKPMMGVYYHGPNKRTQAALASPCTMLANMRWHARL